MTIRLNLGCGANISPLPWVNIDLTDLETEYFAHLRPLLPEQVVSWPEEQRKHVEWIQSGRLKFIRHDIRHGLGMYEDGSVEAIYGGQMVEHFNVLQEVPKFLAECFRVLQPGGRIRLTTPDLDELLDQHKHGMLHGLKGEQPGWFDGALPEDQLCYIMYGAGGPGSTREHYEGHQHLFTQRSLWQRVEAAGFVKPKDNSTVFLDCSDKGMSHSFALEAEKP